MRVHLNWRGEEIRRRMRAAQEGALEETVELAAARARAVHPGWENRSGVTEASIQPRALQRERARAIGAFGFGVRHGVFLEYGFLGRPGAMTLDAAAGEHFPQLAARISRRFPAS